MAVYTGEQRMTNQNKLHLQVLAIYWNNVYQYWN